jgi:hypothetical protein
MSKRLLAHLFFMLSGCLSSACALAASQPAVDLLGLPWAQIGIGAMLSLWGGVTHTAEKALEASKADPVVDFGLAREIGKDVLVSAGIGFLIYAWGSYQEWGVWLLGSALWLGGYAGTRLLMKLADALLTQIQKRSEQ